MAEAATSSSRPFRVPGDAGAVPDPTAEQRAAIEREGGWTLVSAAAGSGKTRVLTQRVVRAVTDPVDAVPLEQVLAVTFTEKAAGELRDRVRRQLEQRAPLLARQVERASIGTIHAFCSGLLRRHALAAGLDPRFVVLDERAARGLREEAWRLALDAFLTSGGSAAVDLLAAYGIDDLTDALARVHDGLRSQGVPVALPALAPVDVDGARVRLGRAAAVAANEVAVSTGGESKTVLAALAALERCAELLADGVSPAALAGLAVKAGNTARLQGPAYTAYLDALKECEQALYDRLAQRDYALMGELLAGYVAAYADAKRAVGGLDFEDLELGARDLLADPAVAERVRSRYRRVLVDEFQDTNTVQLALIRALGAEDVFLVGDEFQSIYAFRHADVGVFRAVRTEVGAGALPLRGNFRSDPAIVAVVNAAFGTLFAGTGFAGMEARAAPAPRAAGPAVELLVTDGKAWTDATEPGEDGEAPSDAPDLGETLPPDPVWRQAEARLLAQRVRDLLDRSAVADGAARLRPGDVAVLVRAYASMPVFEQALNDVGLATIASGARGYWSAQQVTDLLGWLRLLANPHDEVVLWEVLGSPLVGVTTDGLALVARAAQAERVRPWALLRRLFAGEPAQTMTIAEPIDEGGRAPLTLFGDDVGVAAPPEVTPTAVSSAEHFARDEGVTGSIPTLSGADRARLRAFTVRLSSERAQLGLHPLAALIDRIVRATRYDEYVLSLAGGERRLANVRKLRRLATEHEAEHGRDLRSFLDVAADERDAGDREPDAPIGLTDDGAVQLMTIHAAKGLEFPVVCIVDTGRKRAYDRDVLVVRGGEAGMRLRQLGVHGGRQALAHEALRQAALRDDDAEARRLFYVAMTRAERHLIVSGTVRPRSEERDPIRWLGPALDPDFAAALAGEAAAVREAVHGAGSVTVRISRPDTVGEVLDVAALAPRTAPDADLPHAPPPAPMADPDADTVPTHPAAGVEAVSFSALGAYAACPYRWYLERVLRLPRASDGSAPDSGLDALTRGTVVHALLEDLDFAAPEPPSLPAVHEAVRATGRQASDREAGELRALVAAFCASPMCARLATATLVRREEPFAFVLDPTLPVLDGVLDVAVREAGGDALVVDYKTNRVSHDTDLEGVVARDYDTQRALYALASLRSGAPAVDVAFVFLARPTEPVVRRFVAADVPVLEQRMRDLLGGVARDEFPVTDRPHRGVCGPCPGRGGLCPQPPALTDRSPEAAHAVHGWPAAEHPAEADDEAPAVENGHLFPR